MAAADEKFLKEAFEAFDADKSGSIDLKERTAVMKSYSELVKEPADDKKVKEVSEKIMKAVDKGGDGKISLAEFIAAFK